MRGLILAGVLGVAIAGCGGTSTPSASTSALTEPSAPPTGSAVPGPGTTLAATSKPHTQASPKATARQIPVCLSSMLTAKVTSWQGAAGSQIAAVALTNTSPATCTLRGTPEVELVDAHGAILIDSQTTGANGLPHVAAGAAAFRVGHDGTLKTEVKVDNYCGGTPTLPTTVAFVLPSGGGRLVAAPGPGGSTPPCNGAPGSLGSATMNGWTK